MMRSQPNYCYCCYCCCQKQILSLCVGVGGCSKSFYVKPITTEGDVVLWLSCDNICSCSSNKENGVALVMCSARRNCFRLSNSNSPHFTWKYYFDKKNWNKKEHKTIICFFLFQTDAWVTFFNANWCSIFSLILLKF